MHRFVLALVVCFSCPAVLIGEGIDEKTIVTISEAKKRIGASLQKLENAEAVSKADTTTVIERAIEEIETHWIARYGSGKSELRDWVSKKDVAKDKALKSLLLMIPTSWQNDVRRTLLKNKLAEMQEKATKTTDAGDFQIAATIQKSIAAIEKDIEGIPETGKNNDPFAIVGHWRPADSPDQNGVRFEREGAFVNIGFEDWNGAWSWCPQGYYVLIQRGGGQVTHWQFQGGRLYRWGNLITKDQDRKVVEWVQVK
ncbi:hypothetical protein [Thalassoroseus pseudoceratinae]|uniref:hypothetical protein n=1 Tax=Thalassoroseus pseudoceratinae TaxID=2713176 RepID=UPI001422FCD5|nr:hypothetical protein [Thalassoroseus pseudoceratinae]